MWVYPTYVPLETYSRSWPIVYMAFQFSKKAFAVLLCVCALHAHCGCKPRTCVSLNPELEKPLLPSFTIWDFPTVSTPRHQFSQFLCLEYRGSSYSFRSVVEFHATNSKIRVE